MSVESNPKGNHPPPLQKNDVDQISLLDSFPAVCSNQKKIAAYETNTENRTVAG